MNIGLVCPYSFDVAGGVQGHVSELATELNRRGHRVNVLAPAEDDARVPDFVTPAGRSLGIRYNGSVARLSFGPVTYSKVRRWIGDHDFDVLHLHEPIAPSLSLLALIAAEGPIVATFHTSTPRSRALSAFQGVLRPFMEKVTARIAVSTLARRVQVEHLGGDAVEIPNGVNVTRHRGAMPLPGYPRTGGTIGFVGRFDEPRKGMGMLLEAAHRLLDDHPDLRIMVVGSGDAEELRRTAGPQLAKRMEILGAVDDATKARALRSVDLYCAPNTGGESFGMILTEAMAANTAVVASDLPAFRAVLADGAAGALCPPGDAPALASTLHELLVDGQRRGVLAEEGRKRVAAYDWTVVTERVLRVYETAMAADPRHGVTITAAGFGEQTPTL